jgi:hypothetical protein
MTEKQRWRSPRKENIPKSQRSFAVAVQRKFVAAENLPRFPRLESKFYRS